MKILMISIYLCFVGDSYGLDIVWMSSQASSVEN
jgi:hypothetical protein